MAEEKKEQQNPPMFDIIRLYSKDVSFETPNLPEVFKEEWKPETSIDLHVNINDKIDEANNVIEVALRITVTTKLGEFRRALPSGRACSGRWPCGIPGIRTSCRCRPAG